MLKAIQLWNQIQTWVTIQDKVKLVEPAVKEDKMNKMTKKNMMIGMREQFVYQKILCSSTTNMRRKQMKKPNIKI